MKLVSFSLSQFCHNNLDVITIVKTPELRKGPKYPEGNFGFASSIEGRSNTEHIKSNHMNRQELVFLSKGEKNPVRHEWLSLFTNFTIKILRHNNHTNDLTNYIV